MLEKIENLPITEDPLFVMFRKALASKDPMKHFIGKCFAGSMKDLGNTEISISSKDPVAWHNLWEMLGYPAPPMALPPNCKFHFKIVAAQGYDTSLTFGNATRQPSGITMEWATLYTQTKAGSESKAAFIMMLLPEAPVSVSEGTRRLAAPPRPAG